MVLCMIQGESVYFPKLFTINSFIEINVKMWSKNKQQEQQQCKLQI